MQNSEASVSFPFFYHVFNCLFYLLFLSLFAPSNFLHSIPVFTLFLISPLLSFTSFNLYSQFPTTEPTFSLYILANDCKSHQCMKSDWQLWLLSAHLSKHLILYSKTRRWYLLKQKASLWLEAVVLNGKQDRDSLHAIIFK